jgi:ABC-type lipoprotein release transport system permease subunit
MSNMGDLYPATASGRTFIVTPLIDAIVGDLRPILLILLSAAIALLALACVNVAMLIVARGAGQTKELAVRTALGADRGHIVRLFLTESFALAAAGTAVGLVLALACVKLLLVFGASELPRLEHVPLDGRVLVFAIVTLAGSTAPGGWVAAT